MEDLDSLNKMIKYYDKEITLYGKEIIGHETFVSWDSWDNKPYKEGNIGTILNKIGMNYVKIRENIEK